MEMVNTLQYILRISLILRNSIPELVEEWIKTTIHIQEDFLPKNFQTLLIMRLLTQQSSMVMDSMPQYILKTSLILKSLIPVLVVVSTKILTHTQEDFLLKRFQTPHTMRQLILRNLMETVNMAQFG
jgi:hypothetical protein